MKRVSNSIAADTNAVQPGDDDARAPGNVAGDHVGTPTENTKDVLQAIPLDASLAPALPASRCASRPGHPRAGCGKRGAELADLRQPHVCIAGQTASCEALLLALSRRADAVATCGRGSSPTVRHGWHLPACRRPRGALPCEYRCSPAAGDRADTGDRADAVWRCGRCYATTRRSRSCRQRRYTGVRDRRSDRPKAGSVAASLR